MKISVKTQSKNKILQKVVFLMFFNCFFFFANFKVLFYLVSDYIITQKESFFYIILEKVIQKKVFLQNFGLINRKYCCLK